MAEPSLVVVEPDEEDAAVLYGALAKRFPNVTAVKAVSGDAVLQCLTDHPPGRSPHPALLLFDVQSFDDSMHAVLNAVRADARLAYTPIVVFVRDKSDDDLDSAYTLRVNSVISRPHSVAAFVDAALLVADYWLTLNQMPGSGVHGHTN